MRLIVVICLLAGAVSPAAAGPGPKGGPGGPPGPPAMMRRAGEEFCPARTLVYGNVIIPAGRCYVFSVLRDRTGTFLAFVPAGERIPPGQLVRLDTPAGPKLRGRLFLIPISPGVALVPLNTLSLVAVSIQDFGVRVTIVLTNVSAPVAAIEIGER
jgi:hypothetical protein